MKRGSNEQRRWKRKKERQIRKKRTVYERPKKSTFISFFIISKNASHPKIIIIKK